MNLVFWIHVTLLLLFGTTCGAYGSEAQYQREQVTLMTADGVRIHARMMATGRDSILIYCHRLLSSKESFDLTGFGDILLREFDVLALDFRGHGQSEGISTCGGDEVLDLRTAVQYARQKGYRKIVILGVGMGGTVAIRQAALFDNVDAVVAVSPLGQPEKLKPWRWDFIANISTTTDYGRIPIRILNGTRISGPYLTGSPIYLVDRVSPIPLLIVHGEVGQYMNFRRTQKLYENAGEPKEFLILPRSEHPGGLLDEPSAELIVNWVRRVLSDESSQGVAGSAEDSQPLTQIREIDIRGDIVLPGQMIETAIKTAAEGASNFDEQLERIKREVTTLYKDHGYVLSRVSDIQLSQDGQLSLNIEVDKIHSVTMKGNRQTASEQTWRDLQTAEGHYYNAWKLETAMRRLSTLPGIASFESQLKRDSDDNIVTIMIKERRPWSLSPTIKIDSFDYFGGLSLSMNKFRPGAWRVFSIILVGVQHQNMIYRIGLEKSWLVNKSLSTRLDFEQFINRSGVLDYYFARQGARESGGGLSVSYRVTDNTLIHSGISRKKFAAISGDEALPVGPGMINTLTSRLETQEHLVHRGYFSLSWRSSIFVETATNRADGDYDYTVLQTNLYPQMVLSPAQDLDVGLHWGTSWGGIPPQKLFSLGGIRTLPGYGYDAFLGEHFFLMRVKHNLRLGKWIGENSRLGPLVLSILFDAGDARMKSEPLKFDDPQLELGIELSYASTIRLGVVKSLGMERVAPYVYFGWHPHMVLSQLAN